MKEQKYTNDRDANFETRITLLEHRQTTTDSIFIEIKAALLALENRLDKRFDQLESKINIISAQSWTQFILLGSMVIGSYLLIAHKMSWL